MVGGFGDEFSVVSDDNDDGTSVSEFTHHLRDCDEMLVANTGCGLVEDVNFLVHSKCCSNNQALALPARECLGMISLVVGKVEFFKDRVGIDVLLFGFGRAERDFVDDGI